MSKNKIVLGFNYRKADEVRTASRALQKHLNTVVLPSLQKLQLETSREKIIYYAEDASRAVNDYTEKRCKGIDYLPPAAQDATREATAQELNKAMRYNWGTYTIEADALKVLRYQEDAPTGEPFSIDESELHALCVRYVEPHQEKAYRDITDALEALNKTLKGHCALDFNEASEPIVCDRGIFKLQGDTIDLDNFI